MFPEVTTGVVPSPKSHVYDSTEVTAVPPSVTLAVKLQVWLTAVFVPAVAVMFTASGLRGLIVTATVAEVVSPFTSVADKVADLLPVLL